MFARACLLLTLVALPALAQEEDLAPLPIKKAPARPPPAKKAQPLVVKKLPPPAKRTPDEELAPTPAKGELLVKLVVPLTQAILSLDGKELGTLPMAAQPVSLREHTVQVKRAGFATFVKKVFVGAGKSVDVEAKLAPVMAVLSVTSDVAGAQVFIDGRLVGTTPLTDYELPAKPSELAVRKEGFAEQRRTLALAAGKDYPIAVKLAPAAKTTTVVATDVDAPLAHPLTPVDTGPVSPVATASATTQAPLYQRWYFWAGVAAVVTAVAVGFAVEVNAAQPPRKLNGSEICTQTGHPSDCLNACIGCTASSALPLSGAGVVHW